MGLRGLMAAGACVCVLRPIAAPAQTPPRERGRFELAAGPLWTGRASFGSRDALETSASGSPFTLFSTSTDLAAAWGIEARLGVRLTRTLEVEASSSYSAPQLRTAITGDVENAVSVTVSEPVRQFMIGGDVVVHLERWRVGRGVPFVSAGAGYLRQVHEGGALAAAGRTYQLGGGVKYLLVSRPRGMKGIGVRADVRALVRTRGVALDPRARTSPAAAVSMFVSF